MDVIISNCVINLSTDKPAVFREAHRVLVPGGRFAVSDVVALHPLSDEERADLASWAGCLAGALTAEEYLAGLAAAGFRDARGDPHPRRRAHGGQRPHHGDGLRGSAPPSAPARPIIPPMPGEEIQLEAAGRQVRLTSPDKVLFPEQGWTKRDVVEHYLLCAPGVVRGVLRRPCALKRWPEGVDHPPFFTKRAPATIRRGGGRCASPRPGPAAWRS